MPIFANKMRNSSPSADKTFPHPAKNQINDTKLCYRWQTIFACFYLTLFCIFVSRPRDLSAQLCAMRHF